MHLSDVQQFFRRNKKKLVIGFIVFVIIVVVSAFWGRDLIGLTVSEDQKLPPFSLTSEAGSIVREPDLSSLSSVDFPKKATAYTSSVITTSSFTETEAEKLAERFDIKGELRKTTLPDSEAQLLTFMGKKASLMLTTQPRALSYVDKTGIGTEGTIYDPSTAFVQAKKFMSDRGLSTDQLSSSKVEYLIEESEIFIEAETSAQAEIVKVTFNWAIEGRDLFGEAPEDVAAEVIFDRSGKVITLKFNFLDKLFTRFSEVGLLSFSKATSKLQKQGLVVSTRLLTDTSNMPTGIDDLYSFTPTTVQLIYSQPSGSTYIYPIYLFEGQGTTGGGETVRAAVYLLAVDGKYIKSE